MKLIALVIAASLAAETASACVTGMRCIKVPQEQRTPGLDLGDVLPRGEYQMVLNSRYMGLPRPETGTVYYRVDHRILRVDMMSLTILEDMTYTAGRVAR